jgi:hypothetical protein
VIILGPSPNKNTLICFQYIFLQVSQFVNCYVKPFDSAHYFLNSNHAHFSQNNAHNRSQRKWNIPHNYHYQHLYFFVPLFVFVYKLSTWWSATQKQEKQFQIWYFKAKQVFFRLAKKYIHTEHCKYTLVFCCPSFSFRKTIHCFWKKKKI